MHACAERLSLITDMISGTPMPSGETDAWADTRLPFSLSGVRRRFILIFEFIKDLEINFIILYSINNKLDGFEHFDKFLSIYQLDGRHTFSATLFARKEKGTRKGKGT